MASRTYCPWPFEHIAHGLSELLESTTKTTTNDDDDEDPYLYHDINHIFDNENTERTITFRT